MVKKVRQKSTEKWNHTAHISISSPRPRPFSAASRGERPPLAMGHGWVGSIS